MRNAEETAFLQLYLHVVYLQLSLAGVATVQGYYTGTSHVSYSSPYVSFAYGSDHGRAFGGYRRGRD